MRIDAYTHFVPKKFFDDVLTAGDHRDIGKRVKEIPSIHDLDVRLKVIDQFPDYAQILSYPMPPFEVMTSKPEQVEEYARIVNDGFAELCAKHPDHFPGWVAQAPLAAPDAGVRESERAIKELGALGVQIYTNIRGKPLDRPEFEPFFAAMNKLGKPVWIHPARGASHPDYLDEKKSLYEIWWTFGWSYETAVAMSRLVFSKTIDKYPNLKLIVHHFGGIVPMLEGRIGPGWDQLGARTSDEDYVSLRKSMKSGRSTTSSRTSTPTRRCSARSPPPCAALRSTRSRRWSSRPMPVRSREGDHVHPRDAQDPRQPRHAQGRPRRDLLQEFRGIGREKVGEVGRGGQRRLTCKSMPAQPRAPCPTRRWLTVWHAWTARTALPTNLPSGAFAHPTIWAASVPPRDTDRKSARRSRTGRRACAGSSRTRAESA